MVVTAGKRLKAKMAPVWWQLSCFCAVRRSRVYDPCGSFRVCGQNAAGTCNRPETVCSGVRGSFLRDELSDSKTAVKITDVRVVDSREEEPDYSEEYVYTGGETLMMTVF